MRRTIELVRLLHWKPSPEEGTEGYEALVRRKAEDRMFRREQRAHQEWLYQIGEIDEIDMESDDESAPTESLRTLAKRHAWYRDASIEMRMAYGRALMGG
jgi:hypothetical protein